MAQINLQIFGKIKNNNFAELAEYYQKLIGKYFTIDIRISKAQENRQIDVGDITLAQPYIVLSEKGSEVSTPELLKVVDKYLQNYNGLNIVVGNSVGITENLIKSAYMALSLSKLTMPHELAIVVLLEQLFRIANLKSGGKYHK